MSARAKRGISTTDRDALRAWIPRNYSPGAHLVGMFGGGGATVAALLVWHARQLRAMDLLAIPAVVLVGSLVEYVAHRWVMHVRLRGLALAWDAHVGRHHGYYRDDAPTWERPSDIWLVLFSPSDVAVLTAVLAPAAALLARGMSKGTWSVTIATAISYFLVYEAVHLACHLPDDHALLRVQAIASRRRRHLRHHRIEDTHANYGVTGSFWDRVFGTYRGELGPASSAHRRER